MLRLWISSQTDRAIKDGFANLKPAKLRGIMSEGMILCASDAEDKVLKLCTVEPGMEDGAYIR